MTEVASGVVRIRRDMTSWGCDAFTITNIDSPNESVMFWAEDWNDLLDAIEKIRPYMEGKE